MSNFNKIASNIFGIKIEDIKDSLTSEDIPNWDSMNYLLFIAEIEKDFDVSFSMDEVLGTKSLGDIRQLLAVRGKVN